MYLSRLICNYQAFFFTGKHHGNVPFVMASLMELIWTQQGGQQGGKERQKRTEDINAVLAFCHFILPVDRKSDIQSIWTVKYNICI